MTGGALSQQIAGIDTACCANESRLGGRKLNYDEWERPLTTGKKKVRSALNLRDDVTTKMGQLERQPIF